MTTPEPRTFEAVADPAQRPVVRRATVRVLVIDPRGRLLLLRDSDPNVAPDTGGSWWITPGGGIDPGEGELDAVVRELAEETGHVVSPTDVLGPLARRHVVHGYSDRIVDQDDTFYAVRVPSFTVSTDGYTEEERVSLLGYRWWSPAELTTTDEEVWPVELADLLAAVERVETSPRWPIALPDAEESSVPVVS